jgi:hypothetical protein
VANYHVTIHGRDQEAMADLVRKLGVRVYSQTLVEGDEACRITGVADDSEIERLKAAGYRVERHEDVDEAGKESLRHVGAGDRFADPRGDQ